MFKKNLIKFSKIVELKFCISDALVFFPKADMTLGYKILPVNFSARLIDFDDRSKLRGLKRILEVEKTSHDLSLLEVSLAVQIARVEVGEALGVAAPEQQQVGRHHLVVRQVNEVACLYVLPGYFNVPVPFAA